MHITLLEKKNNGGSSLYFDQHNYNSSTYKIIMGKEYRDIQPIK
jgi:hypothetical protein